MQGYSEDSSFKDYLVVFPGGIPPVLVQERVFTLPVLRSIRSRVQYMARHKINGDVYIYHHSYSDGFAVIGRHLFNVSSGMAWLTDSYYVCDSINANLGYVLLSDSELTKLDAMVSSGRIKRCQYSAILRNPAILDRKVTVEHLVSAAEKHVETRFLREAFTIAARCEYGYPG